MLGIFFKIVRKLFPLNFPPEQDEENILFLFLSDKFVDKSENSCRHATHKNTKR